MPIISGSTVIRGSRGTPVAQDANDRLITAIVGSTGNPISQDASDNLIAMMYGSLGNPITQDASNNIVAVMKGDNAGVLETIALDSDNAMKAVLYDNIDEWGNTNTIGLSELAARLNSVVSYDRRGQVALVENFEGLNLQWVESGLGTAGLSTAVVHSGNKSAVITADAAQYKRIARYESFLGAIRVGVEVAFTVSNAFVDGAIALTSRVYDGTNVKIAEILYNPVAGTLKYWNSAGAYVTFATVPAYVTLRTWYRFKFVVDYSTNKYIRCMFQDTEYDLSAHSFQSAASALEIRNEMWLTVFGGLVDNTAYFDNAIITTQEPE